MVGATLRANTLRCTLALFDRVMSFSMQQFWPHRGYLGILTGAIRDARLWRDIDDN